jgi:CubicO group peptidase (beta-lactamase class C family)
MVLQFIALASLIQSAPTTAQLKDAAEYSASKQGFSYLVMQKGKVLLEEYPNGGSASRPTELASGTKSFSGVMALCAEEDGLLKLDEPVSKTLTEWQADSRRDITIRQLLTLTSGISGGPSAMVTGRVPSYKEAITNQPGAKPGEKFQYGPVPFMIFGEVMRRKLEPRKESVSGYMERRIFRPIGFQHGFWRKDADGNVHIPSGAAVTAREWAKFGEAIRLGAKGILKSGASKTLFEGTKTNPSYGLTWWLPANGGQRAGSRLRWPRMDGLPKDIYMAAGAGGQRLYVVPSKELIIVRQAPVRSGEAFADIIFLRKLLG